MRWIKEYFIKNALDKKNPDAALKETLVLEHVDHICIIAQNNQELDETTSFVNRAFDRSVQISGIYYDEKSTDERAFSYKDFSLFGIPEQKIKNYLSLQPDLIIFTSEKANYFEQYLLYLKPKPYAIGFYSEPLKPYLDLMLNKEGKDIQTATEQLFKYLKQIN
ncbi:DUF6913 domain-containing protein [Lunatibacter salilacus]|uniref:DUF6913 domain-containing protein n=1 Tax=Lunatibacter salilacus TaxID=2483804 RepID=UPI00131B34BC|nr:hypothetical protein [Lunatibacter salilacus]